MESYLVSVSITNNAQFIEPVLVAIAKVAEFFGISKDDISKLTLATEEAIVNVINYAYSPDEKGYIDIRVEVEGLDFSIIIHDNAKPFDFTSLDVDDEEMSGLGVMMMQSLADRVEFHNLGNAGREQRIVKHLVKLPEYHKRESEERVESQEELIFDFHELREHEAIEVAQCIYDEFGYTYPSELVYYPQQFYEACQRGDIYSVVATAPNGEVAGHLALQFSKNYKGVAEMAMGVIKRKYRKYSLITILTDMVIKQAKEVCKLNGMYAKPVVYHTITQKMCNRNGLSACSFTLNDTNDKYVSTFESERGRSSASCAMIPFIFTPLNVYLPHEIEDMIREIYDRMNLERAFLQGVIPDSGAKSVINLSVDRLTEVGKLFIDQVGADIVDELKRVMLTVKKEKCATVEACLSITDPSAPYCYEELKKYHFFCTGVFPLTDKGDYLTMECLMSDIVNYDALKTIEPFTTLLNNIRKLDGNEK